MYPFPWHRLLHGLVLALFTMACQPSQADSQAATAMVAVPAGAFSMGADLDRPGDESPRHSVTLPAFRIDLYEVTNARYRKCVNSAACSEPADLRFFDDTRAADHPVVFVSWYQADAYCRWLDGRLPTEAEWEKAARGTQGRAYPWGNRPSADKLNAGLRFEGTRPVGSYPAGASPYGALDMAGNVWEWTADWYLAYAGSEFQTNLFGEKYKVVRGGSWNHPIQDARSFHRDIAHPARTLLVVGFRCAADLPTAP
jgi:formylglycine-generating enzyme required for sulfatase activity